MLNANADYGRSLCTDLDGSRGNTTYDGLTDLAFEGGVCSSQLCGFIPEFSDFRVLQRRTERSAAEPILGKPLGNSTEGETGWSDAPSAG